MFEHLMSIRLCLRNSTRTHHGARGAPCPGVSLCNRQRVLAGWASRGRAVVLLTGLVAAVALLLAPSLAWAQESLKERASRTWERLRGDPDQVPDRLMIRGGAGFVFGASTTITANGPAGIGTSIDFDQTLGGDTEASIFRADAWWRFNSRHSLGFTWYSVDRTGAKTLTQDITWDGATYAAGATVASKIDITLYRFMYNYSFYHTDKVELAVSPGLYFADLSLALAGDFTKNGVPVVGGEESQELTIPLPSIGLLLNYNITPRFMTITRGDFFYLQAGDFRGAMVEFFFGLEYRLFKYFGLGVAYDYFGVTAENTDVTDGWKIQNNWNSVFFYGTLYAFDTPL